MKQYIHCVLQTDESYDFHVVACYENYDEAQEQAELFEKEYTQEYYVESLWLYKKGEEK